MSTSIKKMKASKFQSVKISKAQKKAIKGGTADYVIIEEIAIG